MAKKAAISATAKAVREDMHRIYAHIFWGVITVLWVMAAAALASYDPADWPGHAVAPHNSHAHNWIGYAGALFSHKVYLMLGPGAWILMAGWMAFLVARFRQKPFSQPILRFVGLLLMAFATSSFVAVSFSGSGGSGHPEGPGGLVAIALSGALLYRFNTIGTMMILMVAFWVGALLAMDQLVFTVSRWVGIGCLALVRLVSKIRIPKPVLVGRFSMPWSMGRHEMPSPAARRGAGKKAGKDKDKDAEADDEDGERGSRQVGTALAVDEDTRPEVEAELDDEETAGRGRAAPIRTSGAAAESESAASPATQDEAPEAGDAEEDSGSPSADAPGAYAAERKFDPDALRAKIKALPINFSPHAAAKSGVPGAGISGTLRDSDMSGYRFPGLDQLIEPEYNFTQEMERIVRDQALLLEQALQTYRIEGEVVGIEPGPVITLYEVRLAAGTKVSAVGAVASDLARSLKAPNIRVVPNMAGKDTVAIEVPNVKKEKVRLKELMTVHNESAQKMALPMFLGKDASGTPLIGDLATMPHMLIAGTTGSGKSVCMNSIIMSFLFTKRPDELKLVLVDPKMVEMSMFKDIPHLMCPVVTEMAKAAAILEWATTKMDERYELLAEAGVRDIAGYNSLSWEDLKTRFNPGTEEEEARIPKKLPYLVFIIDELADLMMTNKEIEGFIVRLAQKARAVGLHLILATQRPQANVVTGLIKSNMPCRVSFKVASGMDSRIVLDQKGAELLLGQGDMLYLSPRTSKLVRAQGTLVDDGEIRRVTGFLKEIATQNFEPQLVQLRGPGVDPENAGERDPLFDDAVRVVLETKRGSVSLLQRRLTIGYSRASRLIEEMAQANILGTYKGSQAREVTLTLEEWDAMKAQAEADAKAAEADGTVFEDDGDTDGGVPDEFEGEHKN